MKENRDKKIKIRYHHLMCIPRFEGKGYSEKFCANLQVIKDEISRENYELTEECDAVCSACPNKIFGRCLTERKVRRYDRLVKEALQRGEEPKPAEICSDCKWFYICKDK